MRREFESVDVFNAEVVGAKRRKYGLLVGGGGSGGGVGVGAEKADGNAGGGQQRYRRREFLRPRTTNWSRRDGTEDVLENDHHRRGR